LRYSIRGKETTRDADREIKKTRPVPEPHDRVSGYRDDKGHDRDSPLRKVQPDEKNVLLTGCLNQLASIRFPAGSGSAIAS